MDRNTGLVGAIALALAAFIGISNIPSSKTESSPANSVPPTGSAERVPGLASPPEKLLEPCRQIASRIAQFIPDQSVTPPDSCFEPTTQQNEKLPGVRGRATGEVEYVIATLPDPVHTHFALLFDRLTEAVQQAAQDQGYNYDDSWLPWNSQPRSYDRLEDQQKANELVAAQEKQPGVLVFRTALPSSLNLKPCTQLPDSSQAQGTCDRDFSVPPPYQKGLIVFVVSENPTGGINLQQFDHAVEWIRAITATTANSSPPGGAAATQTNQATHPAGNLPELRILGPYFSGSFPSLAQALLQNNLIGAAPTNPATSSDAQTKVAPVTNQPSANPATERTPDADATAPAKQAPANTPPAPASSKTAANPPMPANPPPPNLLTIFSGTTSSKPGIDWFTGFLGNSPERKFYSFQENDDLMIDRYCQYLTNLGYDTGKLAILSEDETAYGGGQAQTEGSTSALPHCDDPPKHKNAHGPLYLYYPRDIASLRSAYEQQNGSSGPVQSQARDPRLGLPLNLVEPSSRQHDTIRSYGGEETTLSQEATLFGITNLFSSHDIQFIVLRSSNTLDQIFLTRFLSTAYPQARVVLTSADLLFRRSSDTVGFRGTMTLTTYPLLTWQQDWTHPQAPETRHSHRVFPEDFAEGIYLAARFMIDATPGSLNTCTTAAHPLELSNNSVVLQDYSVPSWLLPQNPSEPWSTQPPTWLSVIGNEQLWPVAVIDNNIFKDSSAAAPPASTLPWAKNSAEPSAVDLILHLPIKLLLLIGLFWGWWHRKGCQIGSRTSAKSDLASARYLATFAPIKHPRQKTLIFIGSLVMMSAAVVLICLTGVFSLAGRDLWSAVVVGIVSAALTVFAVLACRQNCQRRRTLLQDQRYPAKLLPDPRTEMCWLLAASAVGGIVFYLCTDFQFTSGNAIAVYWRSLNPLSGVSPIMPMLLLMAGLYAWFWFTLCGLALFSDDRPRLPRYPKGSPYPSALSGKIGRHIEKMAIPLGQNYGKILGIITGILLISAVSVFLGPYHDPEALWRATAVRNLGTIWFGRIFLVCLSVCIGLILLDGWHMLCAWSRLRQLLTALDELPLRRTLTELKGFSWGTVWKMSGNVLDRRNCLIARQMESLQHLQNQLKCSCKTVSGKEKDLRSVDQLLSQCKSAGTEYAGVLASLEMAASSGTDPKGAEMNLAKLCKLQSELAASATLVLSDVLFPAWAEEKHSLIREAAKPDKETPSRETEGDPEVKKVGPPDSAPPEYISAAEEFVALPCLGFIQNILGRIRTMTMGMLFLFVAATVSTACYPFDPRPVLGGMFLAVFAAMASVVIFVYAQMHRDATLSNITNTNPGELGSDFWTKIIAVGIGPVLGLLTALFPQITSFITSWLQPGVQAIK